MRLGPWKPARTLVVALSLTACNAPLPRILQEPAVLEGGAAVRKQRFAVVPDGTNVFDLRRVPGGGVAALTRESAAWFDARGELLRQVELEVDEPLLYTSFVSAAGGELRYAGQLEDDTVVLLSTDGELLDRFPGLLSGTYTVGDHGADGDLELLTSARRKVRCKWPRLCTGLLVYALESEGRLAADTPHILTDLHVVPPRFEGAGNVVLMMYPNDAGGSRFEVWDAELRSLARWDTIRVGGFSLVERRDGLHVLTNEGDELIFRDLEGEVVESLPLPHAGRLRYPRWVDLGEGWGAAVVSGVQAPRFLVAVYDVSGRLVYREVGAPHADDLVAIEEDTGRFLVAAGSEIVDYRVLALAGP